MCIALNKQKSVGAGVSVNQTNTSLTPCGTDEALGQSVVGWTECCSTAVVKQPEMSDRQDAWRYVELQVNQSINQRICCGVFSQRHFIVFPSSTQVLNLISKWEHFQTRSHCVIKWKRLQRLSEPAVWQVRLSAVRRQIVPDWRSSCTEGSVAKVGARLTDEKRTKSVSWAQSSVWYYFTELSSKLQRLSAGDNWDILFSPDNV